MTVLVDSDDCISIGGHSLGEGAQGRAVDVSGVPVVPEEQSLSFDSCIAEDGGAARTGAKGVWVVVLNCWAERKGDTGDKLRLHIF